MKMLKIKCPKCGSIRNQPPGHKTALCFHCGKIFLLKPKNQKSRIVAEVEVK